VGGIERDREGVYSSKSSGQLQFWPCSCQALGSHFIVCSGISVLARTRNQLPRQPFSSLSFTPLILKLSCIPLLLYVCMCEWQLCFLCVCVHENDKLSFVYFLMQYDVLVVFVCYVRGRRSLDFTLYLLLSLASASSRPNFLIN